MLLQHLDRSRLERDLRALESDAVNLKRVLRTRWVRPMADEQRRLLRVRREITERLVLLALARGKLHVRRRPRDLGADDATWDPDAHARKIAARLLPDYAVAENMSEAQS